MYRVIKKLDKFISNKIVYTVSTMLSIIMLCVVMITSYSVSYERLRSEITQENYSWAVAKFVMKLSEFDVLIESTLRTKDTDLDELNYKLDILFSRVKIIRDSSNSTEWLYKEKEYKKTVDSIYNKLSIIDEELHSTSPDIYKVLGVVRAIRPLTYSLANIADHAEVNQRDYHYQQYLDAKTKLISFSWWISIAGFIICIFNLRQFFAVTALLKDRRQAYESKNAFLGVLGHELRTSLQAIISSIDVIKMKGGDITSIQFLDRAASNMERQMSDLSEFAKIDNGIIEIKNTNFNLSFVLNCIIEECRVRIKKETVQIISDFGKDIYIMSDKFRVSQIVENILTNAIKYTDSGTVTLSANVSSGVLTLAVKDTGVGISKEKLSSIFSPFVRVQTNQIPGFGMGLAIVDGLVKRMGGDITVKSEIDKGSLFTVKIPVTEVCKQESGVEDVFFQGDGKSHQAISVLIVDDNELVCNSISSMLTVFGCSVDKATLPDRAFKKLSRRPYDVVLCDIQMPIMNGDILFNSIHGRKGPNKYTPFIFITAYGDAPVPAECVVIVKPARLEDLYAAFRKLKIIR